MARGAGDVVSDRVAVLRKVDFLADVDEPTLARLADRATPMGFATGEILVAELESGADVYVVLEGLAEVSVDARDGSRKVLGQLGPGCAFGEMSSLTGELRSATVTARTPLHALRIADADFDALREQRPACAARLVHVLSSRLADTERSLDTLLTEDRHRPSEDAASQKKPRGSVSRVWRELVVSRQRDLAFFTLAAFVLTLVLVRAGVFLSFHFDVAPRGVLRGAYMTGFALVGLSSCASLLTFRRQWRYAIALAYGIGGALIFNSLGVTLAFDIFYKDIHTPDPNVAFDLERLYRRTESIRAIAIAFVVLIQAVYLRRFYRRAAFVLVTRLKALRGPLHSPSLQANLDREN
jgi:CRP-like cAMP-binding protein